MVLTALAPKHVVEIWIPSLPRSCSLPCLDSEVSNALHFCLSFFSSPPNCPQPKTHCRGALLFGFWIRDTCADPCPSCASRAPASSFAFTDISSVPLLWFAPASVSPACSLPSESALVSHTTLATWTQFTASHGKCARSPLLPSPPELACPPLHPWRVHPAALTLDPATRANTLRSCAISPSRALPSLFTHSSRLTLRYSL